MMKIISYKLNLDEVEINFEEVNEYDGCKLTGYTRRVYNFLKLFPPGNAHPKQSVIADALGCSRRTVERAIATLKKLGFIAVRRVFQSVKGGWINCYQILKKLVRKAPVSDGMSDSYIEEIGKRNKKRNLSPVDNNFEVFEEAKEVCESHGLDVGKEKNRFVKYNQERQRQHWDIPKAFVGWVRNAVVMYGKKPVEAPKKQAKPEAPPGLIDKLRHKIYKFNARFNELSILITKSRSAGEKMQYLEEQRRVSEALTRVEMELKAYG